MESVQFKNAVVESVTAQSASVNNVITNAWIEVICRLGGQSNNPLVSLAAPCAKLVYSAGTFNSDGSVNVQVAQSYVTEKLPILQTCVGQSVELCEFTHDIPQIVDPNGVKKNILTCYCISENNTPVLSETGRSKAISNLFKKLLSQGWTEVTTQTNAVTSAANVLSGLNQVI